MSIHIHAPAETEKAVRTTTCPDCKQRTRMLQFFTPWYGWKSTCVKCGRQWDDGHWLALPFVSGFWIRDVIGELKFMKPRQANIYLAKIKFRSIPSVSGNHDGI